MTGGTKKAAITQLGLKELGIDINKVIDRMKAAMATDDNPQPTDSDLADFLASGNTALKFRPSNVAQWKKRGNLTLGVLVYFVRLLRQHGLSAALDDLIADPES
jgi:hypothetical protein